MCCSKTAVHTVFNNFIHYGSYSDKKRTVGGQQKTSKRDDNMMKLPVSRSPIVSSR